MDAALGLFDVARRQVEAAQVESLLVAPHGPQVSLSWAPAPGAIATRIYGSTTPIRDLFDLRDATFLIEVSTESTLVPRFEHYAATAAFDSLENSALVPGSNTVAGPLAHRVPAASRWGSGALAALLLGAATLALRRPAQMTGGAS